MSKAIAIVGRTKTGKSWHVKDLISIYNPADVFIYDVQNEYPSYRKFTALPPMDKFLEYISRKGSDGLPVMRNKVFIFEEASIFFKHSTQAQELTDILVSKRHTRNLIILNFHSLRKLPIDILDMLDYLIIHRTNDNPKFVEKKFGEDSDIYNRFMDLYENADTIPFINDKGEQDDRNKYSHAIVDMYNGDPD